MRFDTEIHDKKYIDDPQLGYQLLSKYLKWCVWDGGAWSDNTFCDAVVFGKSELAKVLGPEMIAKAIYDNVTDNNVIMDFVDGFEPELRHLVMKHLSKFPSPYAYKQVLVVRKDLNMRMGKVAAQAAHASLACYLDHKDDPRMMQWLAGAFAKICVYVNSEEELLEIEQKAKDAGILTKMIIDQGRTEFNLVPTRTVLAVGPDIRSTIDNVTRHLKLL